MRLLGLDKDCFSDWWSKLPEGSTMVVQPKVDGFAIGLRYKYGQLVQAYSRDSNYGTENIRTINSIPLSIDDSLKVEVELEGVLYSPSVYSLHSKKHFHSSPAQLSTKNESLLFLAFQIFHSSRDELTDLTQLQNWGFDVPVTLRTDDPKQVERWHYQWMNNQLFVNLPTNGIVAKCNSSSTKNVLGVSHSHPNWALALTR
tara:strand:- start:1305 stop:1907 length:603 start_codon:yes stop_codon:yes gene_type:complete